MELPKDSLVDGYINDQTKITNYIYQTVPVSVSGCGPIAAYNALKALGRDVIFEDVLEYFNRTSMINIVIGSNMLQFLGIMRKYRIKTAIHINKKNFGRTDVGILWYKHTAGLHYIMYRRIGNSDMYCFYNAGCVAKPLIYTIEDFLKYHAVSKICAAFELKEA